MFELWKRSLLSIFNCFWKRSPALYFLVDKTTNCSRRLWMQLCQRPLLPHLSTGTWAWEPLWTPHWTKNKQNGKYKIQKHTLPIDTRMPVMLKHNNLCFYASTKYELYILQIVAQSMIWSNNLLYPIWLWSHGWKGVFTVLLEPWEISPRMTWDSWGRDVLRWLRRGGKALRTWWLAA